MIDACWLAYISVHIICSYLLFQNLLLKIYKIQNGKQQTRHLGISSNHRSILITSNRPQGKVKGFVKRNIAAAADGGNIIGGAGAASSAANTPVNELDLSMIVRLQLGQQSRRFFKAR